MSEDDEVRSDSARTLQILLGSQASKKPQPLVWRWVVGALQEASRFGWIRWSPLHGVLWFQRTGQGVVEKDELKKRICRAAGGTLCSGHSQRVRVDLFFRFSFDLCVFRPTRAGCTLGNSKAGPAPTLLPCGQSEPTKASDLDIHNDHENDIDSDSEKDNDNDENDKNDDDDNNDDNDDDKTGDNGNDDNDNDKNDDNDNDENDKNDDDDHENVKNPEKFKMWKTKTIQFFFVRLFFPEEDPSQDLEASVRGW